MDVEGGRGESEEEKGKARAEERQRCFTRTKNPMCARASGHLCLRRRDPAAREAGSATEKGQKPKKSQRGASSGLWVPRDGAAEML